MFSLIFPEGLETQVTESENGKRFTVTSRLRLKPTAADDYMEYSCQARHKALTPDMPMRSTVQLSVLCKSLFNHTLLKLLILMFDCICGD